MLSTAAMPRLTTPLALLALVAGCDNGRTFTATEAPRATPGAGRQSGGGDGRAVALTVLGAPFSEETLPVLTPHPTAVGGAQSLRFSVPGYEVMVDGGAFALVGHPNPGMVTVSASREGSGEVAFVHPTTRAGAATVPLRALPLLRVALRLNTSRLESSARSGAAESPAWALYARASNPYLYASLFAADDQRLVDESLSMVVRGAVATAQKSGWDRYALTALRAGDATVEVSAGGQQFSLPLRVVDAIDDLSAQPAQPREAVVGRFATFCFRGSAAGLPVAGLDWSYAVSGGENIVALPRVVDEREECVSVMAKAPGHLVISATAAGRSARVEFDALPAN